MVDEKYVLTPKVPRYDLAFTSAIGDPNPSIDSTILAHEKLSLIK